MQNARSICFLRTISKLQCLIQIWRARCISEDLEVQGFCAVAFLLLLLQAPVDVLLQVEEAVVSQLGTLPKKHYSRDVVLDTALGVLDRQTSWEDGIGSLLFDFRDLTYSPHDWTECLEDRCVNNSRYAVQF